MSKKMIERDDFSAFLDSLYPKKETPAERPDAVTALAPQGEVSIMGDDYDGRHLDVTETESAKEATPVVDALANTPAADNLHHDLTMQGFDRLNKTLKRLPKFDIPKINTSMSTAENPLKEMQEDVAEAKDLAESIVDPAMGAEGAKMEQEFANYAKELVGENEEVAFENLSKVEDGTISFGDYNVPAEVAVDLMNKYNGEIRHHKRFREDASYRNDWMLKKTGKSEKEYRTIVADNLEAKLNAIEEKAKKAQSLARHNMQTSRGVGGYAALGAVANKPTKSNAGMLLDQVADAREIVKTLRNNGFWSGLDEGFDIDGVLTLGFAGVGRDITTLKALNKANKGEKLTSEEEAIVDLWKLKNDAENEIEVLGGRSGWASLGQGIGQSVEFIAPMALTGGLAGAAQAGVGLTRAAASAALKRVTSKGVSAAIKNGLNRGAIEVGKSVVGATARMPLFGQTYKGYTERRLGQFSTNLDDTIDKASTPIWKDALHAGIDNFSEIVSEDFGVLLDLGFDKMGMGIVRDKLGKAFGLSRLPKAYKNQVLEFVKDNARISSLAGEVGSEAFGDAMANTLKGDDKGWRQMATSDYWWNLVGVSAALSGGFSTISRVANSSTANGYNRQLKVLDKIRIEALNNIVDENLKKQLQSAAWEKGLAERSRKLASIDWKNKNYTKQDVANALDFINAQTRTDILTGAAEETRRLEMLLPTIQHITDAEFGGSGEILLVTDKEGNTHIARDYDNGSKTFTLYGEQKTLSNNDVVDKESIPIAEYIAKEYNNMFRVQEQQEQIEKVVKASAEASRAGFSGEEVADMVRGTGLTVYKQGDEVELLNGSKVVVNKVEGIDYEVVDENGNIYKVAFEEVLQPSKEVAEAQVAKVTPTETTTEVEAVEDEVVTDPRPEVQTARSEARLEAEEVKNVTDGKVYEATMLDDEGEPISVHIIEGRIAGLNTEDGGFDKDASDASIIVRMPNGERKKVAISSIDSIDDVLEVQEYSNLAGETVKATMDTVEADTTQQAEVAQNTEGSSATEAPAEATQQEVQTSEQAVAQPNATPIPTLKNGRPDYNAMSPEMFAEQYTAAYGAEKTIKLAQANIADADKVIADLEKKQDSLIDPNKIDEVQVKLEEAKARKARYEAALNIMNTPKAEPIATEAQSEVAEVETQPTEEAQPQVEEAQTPEVEAVEDPKQGLLQRIAAWEDKLGVPVKVIERVEDIENAKAREAIESGVNITGWYDKNTGEVYFYLPNVVDTQEVDSTIVHEIVAHKGLEQMLGKETFGALCDRVWDMMSEKDRNTFINYPGVNGDHRKAADEYIAYLAERTDLTAAETTIWQEIVNFIREAIAKIASDVQLTNEDIEDLIRASYRNLAAARLEAQGAQVDVEKGDVLFAVKDVLSGNEREKAIKDIMAVTGRSRDEVEKYLKAEESLAKVILDGDNVAFLDLQIDESVPSIWENSDYPQGTVEFSNICRKRLPFTMIYQRLQKEFPNTVFDASTLETIRGVLKDNGVDVACGLCFVEDRRQLLGEIGQEFIDAVRGNHTTTNENQISALEALKASGDTYIPNLYELLTLDGMKMLRETHPEVAVAFIRYNNARGMQAGRLFQAYSAYHREIRKFSKARVKRINDNGGLRIFSFSDFEAHHLIDLVQVLTDCASKGIKVQGYTKVPEFARAVKNTKMKVNRSLIAKDKGYVEDGYVPKKNEAVSPNAIGGKRLLLDTVEGINVNDENFFDSTNSPSIGNILVGINDEQIRLAMADPFVDYIIPFHTGIKKATLEQKGIGDWVNYKNYQVEKVMGANGNLKKAPTHINIYTDVLSEDITNEKQFVKRYLEVCREKGYVPKFPQFLKTNAKGEYVYTKGYYKFLIDFKLFDKSGRILPQEAVVPVFDNAFNKQILDKYVADEKAKAPNDEVYAEVKEALGLEDVSFRVTPEMDARYLSLVEEGNIEEAQKMVDAAANAAGYNNDESWKKSHRAPRKSEDDVNPFNTEELVPADYWAHPEWYTQIRHNETDRESYYNMYPAISKYKRLVAEGKQEEADKVTVTMYRGVDKRANKREASFRNGDWITPSRSYALLSAPYGNARVISQDVLLKDIWWDGNSINEWGYDDGANYVYADTKNNRKSADAVTYDDNGNVIPLSQRFNKKESDIRFRVTKKESPKTATQTKSVTATGIPDDYGAKIGKLKEIYNSRPSKRTRGFITDVSRTLNLEQHGASNYRTFATPLGEVTLRISNHNAKVENFDERGEAEGVSIVISSWDNKGVTRGGNAHVVEYFYDKQSLENSNGRPLVSILDSIEELIKTGTYEDKTGLAYKDDTNNLRFSVGDNAQTRAMNDKQKQPKQAEVVDASDIAFRVSKNNRITIGAWLNKRNDLTLAEKSAFIDYLDENDYDSKTQLATGKWFANGVIRIPEDMPKVEQAMKVASIAKVDPMQYKSPMELIDRHADIKLKEKPINPDAVDTLYDRHIVGDTGIVTYEVEESEESRENMRKIINTHFGEEASPWCLLQGDGKGNLTPTSAEYWEYYSAYPKRVAFKDGMLLAFSANSEDEVVWWDRRDVSHEGILTKGEMHGEKVDIEYNEEGEAIKISQGDRENGLYREWYPNGNLKEKAYYHNYSINGQKELWYENGQIEARENYVDGRLEGVSESWYESGQMRDRIHYTSNLYNGLYEAWYPNGQQKEHANFKFDQLDGVSETWAENGQMTSHFEYKDGVQDGESFTWHKDGTPSYHAQYTNGRFDGVYEYWDEDGQIRSRENYAIVKHSFGGYTSERHGLREEWHPNGQLKARGTYVEGLREGLQEGWFDNGQILVSSNFKKDQLDGLQRRWDRNGNLILEQWFEDGILKDEKVQFRVAPTFYSNAENAVKSIKQEKATPEQWLKMIEKAGGLKAGEDKWLRLSDWLKDSEKKTLTKQEVLDYINENQIQIEEVKYSEFGPGLIDEATRKLESEMRRIGIEAMRDKYPDFDDYFEVFDGELVWSENNASEGEYEDYIIENKIVDVDPSQRGINERRLSYTTQGLTNKREIALTVPTIEPWNEGDQIHFGDAGEGRAIAWIRFGDTTDEYGFRVLVIDEIQSKRHQEGREKGYQNKEALKSVTEEYEKLVRKKVALVNEVQRGLDENSLSYARAPLGLVGTDEQKAKIRELDGLIFELRHEMRRLQNRISAAPFEKNWHELAMKRMLRYAAENGYDAIAWTKGDQQAERYSLGAVLQGLKAYKTSPNTYYVIPYNNGVIGEFVKEYTEKELADTFGKELAVKIIANTEGATEDNPYEIEGDNLRIGGEGMRGFYDQILPSFMNKYGKKWGVKVQDVTLPFVEEAGRTMHSVDVTDAMRESVMEGQPMFSIKEPTDKELRDEVRGELNAQREEKALRSAEAAAERAHEQTEAAVKKLANSRNALERLDKTLQRLSRQLAKAKADDTTVAKAIKLALENEAKAHSLSEFIDINSTIEELIEGATRGKVRASLDTLKRRVAKARIAAREADLNEVMGVQLQKTNSMGIPIAGRVDDTARVMLEHFRKYYRLSPDKFKETLEKNDHSIDGVDADTLMKWHSAMIEVDYLRSILNDIEADIARLRTDSKSYHAMAKKLDELGKHNEAEMARRNRKMAIEARRKKEAEHLEDMQSLAKLLDDLVVGMSNRIAIGVSERIGKSKIDTKYAKEFLTAAIREVSEGLQTTFDEGKSDAALKQQKNWETIRDIRMHQYPSFEFMVKQISVNSVYGEGFLYRELIEGDNGWVACRDRNINYDKSDEELTLDTLKHLGFETLNQAANFFDQQLVDAEGNSFFLEYNTDKAGRVGHEEVPMTIGYAVYLKAMRDQSGIAPTLDKMNLKDEYLNKIFALLDLPQNGGGKALRMLNFFVETLSERRNERYNPASLERYGVQMANIENYFPVRRLTKDLATRGVDMDAMADLYEGDTKIYATALIQRVKTYATIDFKQNPLKLFMAHLTQMNHFAAFAPLCRNLEILLNSKAFENHLKAQKGVGHGLNTFDNFKKAAILAVGRMNDTPNALNKAISVINGLAAGAKISLRMHTALKQILSLPAGWGYSPTWAYKRIFLKNVMRGVWDAVTATPRKAGALKSYRSMWEFCYENIPTYKVRWDDKCAGNENLKAYEASWIARFIENHALLRGTFGWLKKVGMLANALVDQFTCSIIAYSIYEYEYQRYKSEEGKSDAEAKKLALRRAMIGFNTTQQSSEDAFLSPSQRFRDVFSINVSLFANSNRGYGRKARIAQEFLWSEAFDKNRRKKRRDVLIRELTAQYRKEAIDELLAQNELIEDVDKRMSQEEINKRVDGRSAEFAIRAQNAADVKISRSRRQAAEEWFVYKLLLNYLWLVSPALAKSLVISDDDDEESLNGYSVTQMLSNLASSYFMNGVGGSTIQSVMEGFTITSTMLDAELGKLTDSAVKIFEGLTDEDPYFDSTAFNSVLSAITSGGLGFDFRTFLNMYDGVMGVINDSSLDNEDVLRFLNSPKQIIEAASIPIEEGENEHDYVRRQALMMRISNEDVDGIYNSYRDLLTREEKGYKRKLDKWSKNYIEMRKAKMLGEKYEKQRNGSIVVPYLEDLDDRYTKMLFEARLNRGGGWRSDIKELSPLDRARKEQISNENYRMRVHKVQRMEDKLEDLLIDEEAYEETLKALVAEKEALTTEWFKTTK